MKPYYQDEWVTIYHGDCREILPQLEKVDLVLTDPPYEELWADLFPLFQGLADIVMVFGYPEDLVTACIAIRETPNEWVTWAPFNKQMSQGFILPKVTECIAIWGRVLGAKEVKRIRTNDRVCRAISERRGCSVDYAQEGDIWFDASPGMAFNSHLRLHRNEKPTSIITKLIILAGKQAQIILDPFLGSGTTLVCAKKLGRKAIGIEIEEKYCRIAVERLRQSVMKLEVKGNVDTRRR